MRRNIFRILTLIVLQASTSYCGECCKPYNYNDNDYQGFWCDTYCCYKQTWVWLTPDRHECCEASSDQVSADLREGMCDDFWVQNRWVIALIAIGCLAVIGVVIVLFYKFCWKKKLKQRTRIAPLATESQPAAGPSAGPAPIRDQADLFRIQEPPAYPPLTSGPAPSYSQFNDQPPAYEELTTGTLPKKQQW